MKAKVRTEKGRKNTQKRVKEKPIATCGCFLTLREYTCPIRTSVVSTKRNEKINKQGEKQGIRNKRRVGDWGGKWKSGKPRSSTGGGRKEGLLFVCAASPTVV